MNYVLRMHVLFFNHTYPFNAISTLFWIAIPPWIAISGSFPFNFDPVFAICGSLVLRAVEWLIVLKYKGAARRHGTHLWEYSIFRSQQMNEVTVPIKLRAVLLGLWTGIQDCWFEHDNSFWTSFGVKEAVTWVQLWLCSVMLAMVGAMIGGVVNIVVHWPDPQTLQACAFGMVLAFIQIWILFQPTMYVMRNRSLKASLRHTEVVVLVLVGISVLLISSGQRLGIFKEGH